MLVHLLVAAPAHATLIDLGNGLIYDTLQDLTWLQDTAYAGPTGTQATLAEAHAWADALVLGVRRLAPDAVVSTHGASSNGGHVRDLADAGTARMDVGPRRH
ncbi:MAG: hypothetical protein ACRD26_19380 [Vicinamibacterales bacterium]